MSADTTGDPEDIAIPVTERSGKAPDGNEPSDASAKDRHQAWQTNGVQLQDSKPKEEHHSLSDGLHRVGHLLTDPDPGTSVTTLWSP